MADISGATAVYTGYGITVSGWQSAGERNATPAENDMTDGQDGNAVHLEGGTGEAYGGHVGTEVPNLSVTRVSGPAKTRGLPSNLTTNPLTAASPRAHR